MKQEQQATLPFLRQLLELQQDGRQSISAPGNWVRIEPLLRVRTDVHDTMEEVLKSSLLQGGNSRARWHFLIGSPGNGKSAAIGDLCRNLLKNHGVAIETDDGKSINDLKSNEVPYALNVRESNNKFYSLLIVQDASVVKNIYRDDVDPSRDLLESLDEAWSKGKSLVICTNRGILEKAHRDNHRDPTTGSKPWFRILAQLVKAEKCDSGKLDHEWEFDAKKPVFKSVVVSYSQLDKRSLLLGSEIFNNLIKEAVAIERWRNCAGCSSRKYCPFSLNREWLSTDQGRDHFVKLLTHAEILSGQIIVFREALALISFIFAGCPSDYSGSHPCQWVADRIAEKNFFALLSRRIYMCLFAATSPFGLESEGEARQKQLEALKSIKEQIASSATEAKMALEHVLNGKNCPSTDVGVVRLLGSNGIIQQLDPIRDRIDTSFYDRWDGEYNAFAGPQPPFFSELEQTCADIWHSLEGALELTADKLHAAAHWSLRRWSSNAFLHLGALFEGRTANHDALDEYKRLIHLMRIDPASRSPEQKKSVRELEKVLGELLNSISADVDQPTIQLSESVVLAGNWVRDHLKPKAVPAEESGSACLTVQFNREEQSTLSAPMYLWLSRRAKQNLDPSCFPLGLLAGITDARVRAASRGEYAFFKGEVILQIRHPDPSRQTQALYVIHQHEDGEVEVEERRD